MKHRLQWTNLFTLAMLGLYFTASVAVSVVDMVYADMPYLTAWTNMTLYLIGFGLPCLVYAVLLKYRLTYDHQALKTTFSFHRIPVSTVLLCVLLGLLIQPVAAFLAQAASLVFTDLTTSSIVSMSDMPLPMLLFASALLPAVFEECLCRGVIYDGYKEAPLWYQILVSGCFFGMLHMNFQQISYALPMGIFLAVILYTTDSIFSTMIIHFTMNGFQVTMSWLSETKGWFDGTSKVQNVIATIFSGSDDLAVTAAIAAAALGLIIAVMLLLRKIHHTGDKAKRIVYPGWHTGGWIMYMILGFLAVCAVIVEFAVGMGLLG